MTFFGSGGRHDTSVVAFVANRDASLFLLLRLVVTGLRTTRRDPLAHFRQRLVLDDLLQQRFDARDAAQNCLVASLRRHVRGQRGQEGHEHVDLMAAQVVLAPAFDLHQLRVLLASLLHALWKGTEDSLGTSTTEQVVASTARSLASEERTRDTRP